jgi:hypothetical protein
MRCKAGIGLLAMALVASTIGLGCASTEMTHTWVDPSAKGTPLAKIAVVMLSPDPRLRQLSEDEAAQHIKGAAVVPSYRVLGAVSLKDREAVQTTLRSQGFDGVLIMRIAGVSETVTATGGPSGNFRVYYDWATGTAESPGFLQADTTVRMVSNLYSLEGDGKLIWTGSSQTFDSKSAQQFVGDVSKAVAKQLQKDRLVV